MDRPSWDEYGLAMAQTAALRTDCRRSKVGAYGAVMDHSTAATGFNGVDPGQPGCLAGACPRGLLSYAELQTCSSYSSGPGRCISRHAEHNCIIYAERHHQKIHTMFVSREPCYGCRVRMVRHGVSRCVWPGGEETFIA